MAFIEKTDFPASVHDDILNALTKGNDVVITDNVDRTIDEMRAYLNGRYDNDLIFSRTGNERNKFLLRIGVTISKYYIYLVHNPRKMVQSTIDEYNRAIEQLQEIQRGKLNPEGLPTPAQNDPNATSGNGFPLQWGSNNYLGTDW